MTSWQIVDTPTNQRDVPELIGDVVDFLPVGVTVRPVQGTYVGPFTKERAERIMAELETAVHIETGKPVFCNLIIARHGIGWNVFDAVANW